MSILNKKKTIVKDIQENFNNSKAIIFYNFHNTENRRIFQLKKELKGVGAHWKVYKNNLVSKAIENYPLNLKKANAFIFCREDEYEPLNILAKFSKNNSEIRRFGGGIYDKSLVEDSMVEKWSKLPKKEVLIGNICYYLGLHGRRLVDVLEKIKTNKEI